MSSREELGDDALSVSEDTRRTRIVEKLNMLP